MNIFLYEINDNFSCYKWYYEFIYGVPYPDDSKGVIFVDVDEKDNRMQTFIDSNPGIKSRITSTFYFKSYTSKDMVEIFKRIAKNSGYCISNDLDKVVEDFFKKRVSARDFGNGREARVLLETAEVFAAKRVMSLDKEQYSKVDMQTLTLEDIENAIRRMEKSYGKDEKTIRKIGFE